MFNVTFGKRTHLLFWTVYVNERIFFNCLQLILFNKKQNKSYRQLEIKCIVTSLFSSVEK